MQAYANWIASTEAAGNLTEREKGSFCFFVIVISYNARYAKLREVKKPFPRFWAFQTRLAHFWAWSNRSAHSVLFIIFYCFLCLTLTDCFCVMRCCIGSLVIHFVPAILFRQASLCACFITFHVTAVVVQLLLCRHYFACFYQIVSYVWMLTAYNVNYKDPWHYPAKPDRVIGLCIVSSAIQVIRS